MTYFGHKIDGAGLHPLQNKVQAIKDSPTPQSVPELKSYLGMLMYYGKFLPNLSSTLHPLYNLLKDVLWRWGREHHQRISKHQTNFWLILTQANLPVMLQAMGLGLCWHTRCLMDLRSLLVMHHVHSLPLSRTIPS